MKKKFAALLLGFSVVFMSCATGSLFANRQENNLFSVTVRFSENKLFAVAEISFNKPRKRNRGKNGERICISTGKKHGKLYQDGRTGNQ